jgi:hypothetical protein
MIPAMQISHEGWLISTACWDEVPPYWKPGDPYQYCASGKAELVNPSAHKGAWLSKATIVARPDFDNLYTDFNAAHATVVESLREMIDALKVP